MHAYLMSLFKALRILLQVSSIYIIFLNCFYIAYWVKGKQQGNMLHEYVGVFFSKKKNIIVCQIILVAGIILSPPVFSRFENTNIGSFLEKETYTEQYYVYIRTNLEKTKSYRLKADIIKGDYGYPSYTDEGEETFVVTGNGYFVERVYWGNGGYLTFLKAEDFLESTSRARVYPGKEVSVIDYKDERYYVTLTTEKVPKSQRQEKRATQSHTSRLSDGVREQAIQSLKDRGYYN